ncbi:pyridoxal phosphate-dependent transferase, partial [Mycena vulgaris]
RTIRFNDVSDLERALELNGTNLAAFLVEPVQGDAGYLSKVHALCKKHNVLLICDEIQTGLCRTGKMLACEYDNVRPDLVLLGKALSGGGQSLLSQPPLVTDAAASSLPRLRGRGLLNAVVIDEAKSARGRTAWQFCLLLKSHSVLAKPTHVNIVRFAPPLVISEEDLLRAVRIIDS